MELLTDGNMFNLAHSVKILVSPPYHLNVLSLSRPSSLFFALLSILIESSDARVSISSTVRGALYKLLLCFLDIWRSPICLYFVVICHKDYDGDMNYFRIFLG